MSNIIAKLEGGEDFVVKFEKDNCGPCKMIEPVLKDLEKDGVDIERVNVAGSPGFVLEHEVQSAPTLIHFKHGVEVGRTVGVRAKTTIQRELVLD